MPSRAAVAPQKPQTVNVSVDMPQNPPTEPPEKEEKSPMWFWEMLQSLPREQWGNVYSVMAWREEPKVPGVPGAKGFLFEAFEPVTLSYFKEKYGGGKFKAVLQKNSRFQTTHIFDIEGQPKYDLSREAPHAHPAVAANGDNVLLKQFVDVLRDELARSREANSAPNPATDEAIKLVSSASEKAMEIVAGRAGSNGNSTQQLAELVTIVKGLLPAQSGGLTLESLAGLLSSPLLAKFFTPVDPMAQMTTFLTIFEKLDALRGGGGEGGSRAKDWRAMLAEGAVQKAPEILKEMREIVQENRQTATERRAAAEAIREVEQIRRGVPVTPASVPVAVPPPAPAAVPSGQLRTVPIARTDVNNPVHPEPAMSSSVDTPTAAPGMSQSESDAVANFMERRIVEMIEDERDAEDVVDFIEEIDPTMNNMLAQFSAEIVTTFLAGRPIIGKATKHPRWPEFLDRAQKYIREIRAEDAAIDAASTRVPA